MGKGFYAGMQCLPFAEHFSFKAPKFYFGLNCPQSILPIALWLINWSFTNCKWEAVFFSEHCITIIFSFFLLVLIVEEGVAEAGGRIKSGISLEQ